MLEVEESLREAPPPESCGADDRACIEACAPKEHALPDPSNPSTKTHTAGKTSNGNSNGVTPVLVSGAGHDAMVMANITRMGMVFVRCRDGISHSPAEYVAPEDVAAAVTALYEYIRDWVVQ